MLDEYALKMEGVSFSYEKEETIKKVDIEVKKGEFVAILGENGAGKTTLIKLLSGIYKPNGGEVNIFSMNTKKTKMSTIAKKVGFLYQNPDRQICQNTVKAEIEFGLTCVCEDKEYIRNRAKEIIEKLDFLEQTDPFSLSKGERQRLALASLIAVKPEILILDEPTTGLDYHECTKMMNEIRQLNIEGITVIMVCHDMEIVLDYAKRIVVMCDGEKLADGNVKDIFNNKEIIAKSAILQPQIIELAGSLDHSFKGATTVEDVINIINQECKSK